jgi:hypothetical protein
LARAPDRLCPAEQLEPAVQMAEELDRGQGSSPRRGELDRERDAVEPPTELADRRDLLARDVPAGADRARAVREETNRRRGGRLGEVTRGRQPERPQDEDVLAVQAERLAARGEQAHSGAARRRVSQSRAVARSTCSQLSSTTRQRASPRPRTSASTEAKPSSPATCAPMSSRGEIGESSQRLTPCGKDSLSRAEISAAEAGLPDPARTDHRHHATLGDQLAEARELRLPADEGRDRHHASALWISARVVNRSGSRHLRLRRSRRMSPSYAAYL